MRAYNKEQIVSAIQEADEAKIRNALLAFALMTKQPDSVYKILKSNLLAKSKIIEVDPETHCFLSKGRAIKLRDLENLSNSYMMDYIEEIIEAADRNDGPHATREIMLIAASTSGKTKVPFITSKGILMQDKIRTGYILSLAGYKMKGHYRKDVGQSRKSWSKIHGQISWTKEERAIQVRFRIKKEIEEANKTKPKVEDLI
jgi:hypothetical protein